MTKGQTIKTGSRNSELALWQAKKVCNLLDPYLNTEIIGIKTQGDLDQKSALHQFGSTGVFTKAIDRELLEGRIDVGIHSLKDYPSTPQSGLALFAVLERDEFLDIFIPSGTLQEVDFNSPLSLASGSPRRKAQWLNRYPEHSFVNLRGNMKTRLKRISEQDGGIVSKAGLSRLGILPKEYQDLHWMVPSPGQGVVAIVGREKDHDLRQSFEKINHHATSVAVHIERLFMATVEAGCSAPLGAFARAEDELIQFTAVLSSLDGKKQIRIEEEIPVADWKQAGKSLAIKLLEKGGKEIMQELKANTQL